jgi:hypothetical protein
MVKGKRKVDTKRRRREKKKNKEGKWTDSENRFFKG